MQPNSKYLVKANTINMVKGSYVEGITADGDCFALARDVAGLEAHAKDAGYEDLADMLSDLDADAEYLLNKPFLIYGSGGKHLAAFNEDMEVAVIPNGETPKDFWPQAV